MCGISGIVGPGWNRTQLEAMIAIQHHRGPDDLGLYIDERQKVGLGHNRLSIIDLSPAGHQPMSSHDGKLWIVFNGEIYNYLELKAELEADGHRFRTTSDSEVIVHLYEKYGTEMFQYLNGMFGLVLWDSHQGKLVLGRDRLGQKPLYYSTQGERLLFASELKSLLASGEIKREINPRALDYYFIYQYIPHPLCIFCLLYTSPSPRDRG